MALETQWASESSGAAPDSSSVPRLFSFHSEEDEPVPPHPGFFSDAPVGHDWDDRRKTLAHFFSTAYFNLFLGVLIAASMVILVMETDAVAAGAEVPLWMAVGNYVLIGVFIVEQVFRMYVFRTQFFFYAHNVVDFIAVVCDFCIEAMWYLTSDESLLWLRNFRLLRLGRAVRFLTMFPELRIMLKSLFGALKVIFWGGFLVLVTLLIWAILGVQLLNGYNQELAAAGVYDGCPRCSRAFESTFQAMLTLTKHLIAGDSWGEVAVPLIEAHPWTYAFFFLSLGATSIAILNLILAVIVDAALETRNSDHVEQKKKRDVELMRSSKRLWNLFQKLDSDRDGVLSAREFQYGFENNEEFETIMKAMDISVQDLETVFSIMDENGTGDIDYGEFVEQLHKLRSGESHTMLVFIRYMVSQIREHTQQLHHKHLHAAVAARNAMVKKPTLFIDSPQSRPELARTAGSLLPVCRDDGVPQDEEEPLPVPPGSALWAHPGRQLRVPLNPDASPQESAQFASGIDTGPAAVVAADSRPPDGAPALKEACDRHSSGVAMPTAGSFHNSPTGGLEDEFEWSLRMPAVDASAHPAAEMNARLAGVVLRMASQMEDMHASHMASLELHSQKRLGKVRGVGSAAQPPADCRDHLYKWLKEFQKKKTNTNSGLLPAGLVLDPAQSRSCV